MSSASAEAPFVLDGVTITSTESPPISGTFGVTSSDNVMQRAAIDQWHPFREVEILAVPFGTTAPTENLPPATSSAVGTYRVDLAAQRASEGCTAVASLPPTPVASLFGSSVSGAACSAPTNLYSSTPVSLEVAEWVTSAFNAIWIVRYSQEMVATETAITTPTVTVIGRQTGPAGAPSHSTGLAPQTAAESATQVPTPPWWTGDCDATHYHSYYGFTSYRLGAVFAGLEACGPRPVSIGSQYDVPVSFFPGAWGELEWECLELSMRWLYQEYGIPPYAASGKSVVSNYSGTRLTAIYNNAIPGVLPGPGDVLSFNPASTDGHTAVVSSWPSVDRYGNGSVGIIEQNASPSGSNTIQISGWRLVSTGSGYTTIGWLHDDATQFIAAATTGTLYHGLRNAGGSWTPFNSLNNSIVARAVAATGDGAGNTQYIVAASTGTLYHTLRDANGSWTPLVGMGNSFSAVAVSAAWDGVPGETQFMVVSSTGALYHEMRTPNGSWTGFAPLNNGFVCMANVISAAVANQKSAPLD